MLFTVAPPVCVAKYSTKSCWKWNDDDDDDDDDTTFLVNVEDTNMKVSTYEPNYHHHHHRETSSSSSPPPLDPLLSCNSFTITETNCSTVTVTKEVANINKLGCQSLTFKHYHHQYHHHHHYYYNRKPKCSDFKHYSEIPNSSTGGDEDICFNGPKQLDLFMVNVNGFLWGSNML